MSRLSDLGLLLVIGAYLALALTISQVTPFNKGPDEGINLVYIDFIAVNSRLPLTYDERELVGPKANWPALYHLTVAGLGQLLGVDVSQPPVLKVFWDSFRYRTLDSNGDDIWYLLSEDQNWPYFNRIMLLHLGRWLSVLFSALTLVVVYRTALEILPEPSRPLALAAMAMVAFIPTYIFLGSVLNEDALVALLAAVYFWLLVLIIKNPQPVWRYGLLGLVLGLSVTAKYTTVVLPLEVVGVVVAIAWKERYGWGWTMQRLGLAGVGAVLASSWWFGWNLWYLNEVDRLGWFAGLLRPLLTGGTDMTMARLGSIFTAGQIGVTELPEDIDAGSFPRWVQATSMTFWGVIIRGDIPWSPYVYGGVVLVSLITGIGIWRLWRSDAPARFWLIFLVTHVSLFLIAPLVRFGLSRRIGQTAQGRHILIPAAAAVAILLVWGLSAALPRRWRFPLLGLVVAGLLAWSGVHAYRLANFSGPLLPYRTVPQAAGWLPHPVNATFGEAVELASYNLELQPHHGRLGLELAWRSLAYVNENYRLMVRLLNAEGEAVSHWTGYHGQGRVPTLAWDPGDVVFDRLALPLPELPAGAYTLQVELVGQAGPVPVTGSDRTALRLTEIKISQPTGLDRPAMIAFVEDGLVSPIETSFALWRADGPVVAEDENQWPHYRYPGTITLIAPPALEVELVDPDGQAWSPTQRTGMVSTFVIGPRWISGEYRASFSWSNESQATGPLATGSLTTEPLLEVDNWWERTFEIPDISTPGEANFANQILFLGYKLPDRQVKAGQAFPLTLYWQALPKRAPQAEFIQFNKLLDQNGQVWGGYDRQPLEYYNTLLWAPGEVVVDGYAVPVDPGAPPGEYYLNVGYYLPLGESAVTLPLVVDGQRTEISSVTIGPIEVTAP